MIGRLPRTEGWAMVTTGVTMAGGEPTRVFRRVPDIRNTLADDEREP